MIWRVLATQTGQYNQVLRQEGEVFDLLLHEDGSYPKAVRLVQKKGADGRPIPDEYDEEVIFLKDGKTPVHAHFAEDQGSKLIKHGPRKGDVMRFGWMKRVPDRVPVGLYPVGTDFWRQGVQLPQPYPIVPGAKERGQEDHRRNHARMLDVLPKEEVADAA